MREFRWDLKEVGLANILNAIHIGLNHYDDIFSDFDPSPYSERVISEDFLKEMQRRHLEMKTGEIEIRFTLPATKRDPKIEALIKKRLRQYFAGKTASVHHEMERLRKRGLTHVGVGAVLLASEVLLYALVGEFPAKLISILLVPAGWYAMYSGFENLFDHPNAWMEKKIFYDKLNRARYVFISDEDVLQKMSESSEKKESLSFPGRLSGITIRQK